MNPTPEDYAALIETRRATTVGPSSAHGVGSADAEERPEVEERITQAQLLVNLASDAELFHTPAGDVYGAVRLKGHRETWPLRSKSFRRWLVHRFYGAHGKPPNAQALSSALGVLEARAQFDGDAMPVFTRLAERHDRFYLDLTSPNWEAVEIDAAGWRVVSDPPVRFRRPSGMLALPYPMRGGSIEELRPFVNVGEGDWKLLVAWLVATLRPTGPYPVLTLQGEQGSAKSTTGRVLRSLVDPSSAPLRAMPRDERDLMISATNAWIMGFDNLSAVPQWLSNGLCRLATDSGFSTRELYTDAEEIIFDAQRPIILNGIEDLATRGDLRERALILYLPRIEPTVRRDERDFWRAFEAARPRILGALLDAVSGALIALPSTRLTGKPRMADFACWVTAAEAGLGWAEGSFLEAYAGNVADAVQQSIEHDPVASALRAIAAAAPFSGTATQLLARLNEAAGDERHTKEWPANAQAFGNRLRRIAPDLRAVGLFCEIRKSNGRRMIDLREHSGEQNVDPVGPADPVTREPPPPEPSEGRGVDRVGRVGELGLPTVTWVHKALASCGHTEGCYTTPGAARPVCMVCHPLRPTPTPFLLCDRPSPLEGAA